MKKDNFFLTLMLPVILVGLFAFVMWKISKIPDIPVSPTQTVKPAIEMPLPKTQEEMVTPCPYGRDCKS